MNRFFVRTSLIIPLLALLAFRPVEPGESIPDFTATDENGKPWTFSQQRANYLVIYFYPAAFTGGCTAEACAYRDFAAEFSKLKAKVIGISGDEASNLTKFKEFNNLNFTLLSDHDGSLARLFGVPVYDGKTIEKEVNGQTLQLTRGVTASRWTFVVDVNGKLIYRDKNVSASTDPETVLKFLKTHDERKSCRIRK
jgi:peroxiredoxin Q/BCP